MASFDSKRDPWQHSPKVSQLRRSVLESFNEKDRAKFTEILIRFQQNKNIQLLAESLQQICNTPQQRDEIYPLVRTFIPRKHRERFDYECWRPKSAYGGRYATYSAKKRMPKYAYYTTRSLPSEMHNRLSGSSLGSGRSTPSPKNDPHITPQPKRRERKESDSRIVVLDREVEGESFGFCIRGGSEYNIGLFVSSVDEGSTAYNAGICLGDQILEANRVDFRNISHQEAVEVIQKAPVLHMLVKSVGKIPGSFKSSSAYRWMDTRGNEVSPPSEYARENMRNRDKSEMRLLDGDDERKVNLFVADGAEIGLKIRGGKEHGLGIFIASVDRNSGADRAGIQVGDQILDVNGKSFLNISHDEAVQVLKSSQQLVIMLKDIGILPHGKRVFDETRWIRDAETKHSSRSSSENSSDKKSKSMKKTPSFHEPMGSSQLTHHSVLDHSDEILELKAKQVLSSNDLQSFAFYLNEYRTARLSLTSFFTVLSDLLDTPGKCSLFQEIRSAILPRDLKKFDEWSKRYEHTRLQAVDPDSREARHDRLSLYSYKSSDSSTNSWLGLFEDGDEQRTKTNFKFRHKLDVLPHPPPDFFEDSLDSNSMTRDHNSRPREPSFDDLPPSPVFEPNMKRTPRNIGGVATKQTSSHIGLNGSSSSPNKKSTGIFAGVKPTSTSVIQSSQLQNRENGSHTSPRDRQGNMTTTMAHMGVDGNLRGIDKDPPDHSGYHDDDDDGLYTPVNYKGSNRTPGNFSNEGTKIGKTYSVNPDNGSYTSVNDKNINGKQGNTIRTSSSNVENALGEEDVEDGLYTSVDHSKINGSSQNPRSEGKNSAKFSPVNGFPENEDKMSLYATVDKTSILRREKNNFPEDEFEIPPPIPDMRFLETETEPSKTGQNSGRDDTRNVAVETEIASFPERLQKFNKKSSIDANKKVKQKPTKTKKNKPKGNVQTNEHADYSQPFVVELTKHSSNLGLSVTGGTDTESKEIRIKSIKDEGTVAGSCPLLQPGQIILGVDEKSLQNVTSGIAAMAIRQAFHSDKTVLKLILKNDS